MSQIFSTLLGGLNKFGGGLGQTMGALKGPLAIFDMIAQTQQQQKQKAMLDRQIFYAKHPEALANLEKQYEQPLSKGLTSGVGNIVQAQMAERGLNQAPGIYGEVLAQALAPYQLQEQQNAMQMAFKQLGLPGDILAGGMGGGGSQAGMAGLLQSLGGSKAPASPGGGMMGDTTGAYGSGDSVFGSGGLLEGADPNAGFGIGTREG